ncbi:hypothetical protein A8990_103219 [Paenibacillus taihuensis]|uniref:Uncharacterized protein n=1 Tax=Paenibacillus taihuensis TaxID=1156355 RepID=A0A3D9SDH5_9BACL|nr:hypothetical protein A8990_103219 [Paenibacillus taihuensis]
MERLKDILRIIIPCSSVEVWGETEGWKFPREGEFSFFAATDPMVN